MGKFINKFSFDFIALSTLINLDAQLQVLTVELLQKVNIMIFRVLFIWLVCLKNVRKRAAMNKSFWARKSTIRNTLHFLYHHRPRPRLRI